MSYVEVKIEWYEMFMAANVGITRRVVSLKNRLKSDLPSYGLDVWGCDIEGAIAELVVAKMTGRYWDGSVNKFKNGGDIGDLIQVRHTLKHENRLIVRDADHNDKPFVFVTGRDGLYRVHGWILGRDAKRAEWREAPINRQPAFFVKQQDLNPIETLKENYDT